MRYIFFFLFSALLHGMEETPHYSFTVNTERTAGFHVSLVLPNHTIPIKPESCQQQLLSQHHPIIHLKIEQIVRGIPIKTLLWAFYISEKSTLPLSNLTLFASYNLKWNRWYRFGKENLFPGIKALYLYQPSHADNPSFDISPPAEKTITTIITIGRPLPLDGSFKLETPPPVKKLLEEEAIKETLTLQHLSFSPSLPPTAPKRSTSKAAFDIE